MGTVIDGRLLAKKYREEIKEFVQNRINRNLRVPCLATILVGEDGGSISYIKNQSKVCEEVGVLSKVITLRKDIEENELINIIEELNNDESIDGIMLQVPLPKHLNEKFITSKISYKKDVDGLTDINTGRFYKGESSFIPCTPKSILQLIKSCNVDLVGKNAVVLGRSSIVGKPVAQLLLSENATVTICHSKTKNLKEVCSSADILVSAIGRPGFVTDEYVKDGAIVIDVGTTMVNGKLSGDVNFESAFNKASFITPVPGGVGAMTTTMLIKNTCEASENNVY